MFSQISWKMYGTKYAQTNVSKQLAMPSAVLSVEVILEESSLLNSGEALEQRFGSALTFDRAVKRPPSFEIDLGVYSHP